MILLEGYCPRGCGQTLYAEEMNVSNRIICMGEACDDPVAVNKLLQDSETEHVVRFSLHDFTVRHPLRERIGDELMDCDAHTECSSLRCPPEGEPGLYRMYRDQDGYGEYRFERIST